MTEEVVEAIGLHLILEVCWVPAPMIQTPLAQVTVFFSSEALIIELAIFAFNLCI